MEQEKIDKAFKADEESKLMVTLLNEISISLQRIAAALEKAEKGCP